MARRLNRAFQERDISSWNFIIFLSLAFILLVVILSAMSQQQAQIFNLRSRALGQCPAINTLPRAEDCPGGWTYKRGIDGCTSFFCEAK